MAGAAGRKTKAPPAESGCNQIVLFRITSEKCENEHILESIFCDSVQSEFDTCETVTISQSKSIVSENHHLVCLLKIIISIDEKVFGLLMILRMFTKVHELSFFVK